MKAILILLVIFSGFILTDAFASEKNTFAVGNFVTTTFNDDITNISLNWDASKKEPLAKITFNKIINDDVIIHIPLEIPRFTNLDFGQTLHVIQTDGTWTEIKETNSQCFYILEIPVINSDYVELEYVTPATGNWTIVAKLDQSCGDFSLKDQIRNGMSATEIECKNSRHVLTQRPNSKLSCVYEDTADKLDWKVIHNENS